MEDTMMQEPYKNCIIGKTAKINQYVLFGFNLVLTFLFMISHYSLSGILSYLFAMSLLFWSIYRAKTVLPAVSFLPYLFLADMLVFLGVFFSELKGIWNLLHVFSFMAVPMEIPVLLFVAGTVTMFVGFVMKKRNWITGISLGLLGSSAVFQGWSNGSISRLRFSVSGTGGRLLLAVLLIALAWTVILYIIENTTPKEIGKSIAIGYGIAFVAFLICAERNFLQNHLSGWQTVLQSWMAVAFRWSVVIPISVLFLGMVAAIYLAEKEHDRKLTVDSYALLVGFDFIFIGKLISDLYFSHNWIFLVLSLIGTLYAMNQDCLDRKPFLLDSLSFLALKQGLIVCFVLLLKSGLWWNAAFTLLLLIIFYQIRKKATTKGGLMFWGLLVGSIGLQALAYALIRSHSKEVFLLLLCILAVGLFAMILLHRGQIGPRGRRQLYSIGICIGLALLCSLTVTKYGIRVQSSTENQGEVLLFVKQDDVAGESPESAYYYWRDSFGKRRSENTEWNGSNKKVKIENEVLVVVTKDKKGVTATKVIWYPFWKEKLGISEIERSTR